MVIGIITLSFNQAQFLAEAINSVQVSEPNQLEYVIVDPGSKDQSREIISKFKDKLSAVILEPDVGPADGLNKGFSRFRRADVCCYLNADDRFVPGALDYVCRYFEKNPSIDVLLGGILIVDQHGKPNVRGRHAAKVSLKGYAEGTCQFWQQGTFFRRSAFDRTAGFNIANKTCWDAEFLIDMMLTGARVGYSSTPLGEFRIHKASITGTQNARHQEAYRRDQERLSAKIYSSGIRPRGAALRRVARLWHRLSPIRQAANLAVGIASRRSRRETATS